MSKTVSRIVLLIVLIGVFTVKISIRQGNSQFSVPLTIEWDRAYGGLGEDQARAIIQTSDGGYAMAGWTSSFGAGWSDFWLVKTDANGNMQWSRTNGGLNEEEAHAMVQTSDGGYAIAGVTGSFGAGSYDWWLIKTDKDGNMEWNHTYGGTNRDHAYDMIETSDGGFALAGQTDSFGAGGDDWWVVKTDMYGNMEWNKTYGGSLGDNAESIVQTEDGGYLIAGNTNGIYEVDADLWVVKVDSTGNMQWNKTFGGPKYESARFAIQTSDSGYAIVGYTESFGAGLRDYWLIKTDSDGNIIWDKTFGGPNHDNAESVVQTGDSGYLIAGTKDFLTGNSNMWMIRTDSAGNMQWDLQYGHSSNDLAYSMVKTKDGGYAIAGCTTSFSAGNYDFWLIKLTPRARLVDFFLHVGASLDNNSPTAVTAKYKDSLSIKFSGGNPWKEIGIWTAPASLTDGRLEALCGLDAWLGLKNSDDQGTNFDLRVEVYKNSVLVASGETYLIKGVTRNPDKALKVTVSFGSFSPVDFDGTNDTLSLRILTRIGTDGNGKFGGGHSSAVGLRLYFDAVSRPAMLAVSIG